MDALGKLAFQHEDLDKVGAYRMELCEYFLQVKVAEGYCDLDDFQALPGPNCCHERGWWRRIYFSTPNSSRE